MKQLLYLKGMYRTSYWISVLLNDLSKLTIFLLFIFPLLLNLSFDYLYFLPIVYLYLISFSLFNYVFSFLYSDVNTAQKYHILITYVILFIKAIFIRNTWFIIDIFPMSSFIHSMNSVLDGEYEILWILFVIILQISFYSILLYILDNRLFEKMCMFIESCFNKSNNLNESNSQKCSKSEMEKINSNKGKMNVILYNITKIYGICRKNKALNNVKNYLI